MVVFDEARGELLVHGGVPIGMTSAVGETYAFDGAAWHLRTAMGPALQNAALGYSVVDNLTVLAGGFVFDEQIRSNETWHWNGTNWSAGVARDRLHRGSSFGYDRDANVLLYIQGADSAAAGTTALWTGGTWGTDATMSKNFESVQAWDPNLRRMISFSGLGALPLDRMESRIAAELTWTQMLPPSKPPGRRAPGMATDFARNEIIVFGGQTNEATRLADTWIWNGADWRQVFPLQLPDSYGKLVWDSTKQRVLMFVEASADDSHSELWTWTGTNWQQLPRC